MSRSNLIQVFEYDKLTIYPEDNIQGNYITVKELLKLTEFNDSNKNQYFTVLRNGIRFSSFVGVIQIGGITIEILPKADKNNNSHEYDKWRRVLLNMLAICKRIKIESVSTASLSRRYYSILDLYFELFLNELEGLLHKGLIKKYRNQSGNINSLKGKLLFSKNIQLNIVHQELFFTSHQVYDYSHLINQILLKALYVLGDITTNPIIKDRVYRVKSRFPEIEIIDINPHHFDKIIFNRKTNSYKEAVLISKMILLNYSPDIKKGNDNMLALLFDMNTLWEEYVFKMLERVMPENYSIQFQAFNKFWESKRVYPDIVITRNIDGNKENFIVDTKWKVIGYQNPSDDDLKQMYVYNLYWNASKSMLLYPNVYDYKESFGSFHKGREGDNLCKLGFVDVLDKFGVLDMNIGLRILDKLEIK